MPLNRGERLALFYGKLLDAQAANSFESALALISRTLDAVEDEHSGEPNEPYRWSELQRMFPPQMDRIEPLKNRPGVWRARSFRHFTLVGANGSIEIWRLPRQGPTEQAILELAKPGADGKGLP